MAGFMAMGYIGFLATGTGTNSTNGPIVAQQGANPTTGTAVSPVQQRLASLTARVEELANREKTTSKKLTEFEEAFRPTAALSDPLPGSRVDDNAVVGNALPSGGKSSANVSVNVLPLTENDKITEFDGAGQLENYGIDLASALSVETLKRHWSNLKKSNPSLIKGLKPHFLDKGTAEAPLYLLVVGPFDRMSDARGRCAALSKANIECQETRYQDGSMENIHTAGRN